MFYEGHDRRRFKRVNYHDPVQYQHDGFHHLDVGLAHDFSEGGIRITIKEFFPPQTKLILQIRMSTGMIQNYLGKIVWIKEIPFKDEYLAGVMFEEVAQRHVMDI